MFAQVRILIRLKYKNGKDTLSSWTENASSSIGVPQGSILGPLLFLIYVNDLPDCHLASAIILYADDTVLYYSSKSVSDLEHHFSNSLIIHKFDSQ